jgi:peptidoglycan/xylan/chitin deacetylase (PgdA/CDA1 family)
MKKLAVKMFLNALTLTRGFPLSNLYSGRVQILMFHRVVEDIGHNRVGNHGIEVTTEYLDKLILFYKRHNFKAVSISELPGILKENGRQRYVIYTFDDGYADNLANALPVFEKHSAPFAVYVTTDFISRKQFAWWYFLEDILKDENVLEFPADFSVPKLSVQTSAQKEHAFVTLRKAIQENPKVLDYLLDLYKPDLGKYHGMFLDEQQLKILAASPLVTIGSHTLSHPSLRKIDDATSLMEIGESKYILEQMAGTAVEHFAYPFGTKNDFGDREMEYVKSAGYLTALTTVYGDVRPRAGFFDLPRIWTAMDNNEMELLKNIYGINAFLRRG